METTTAAPDWIETFADAMRIERGLSDLTVSAYKRDVEQFVAGSITPPVEVGF